jgi:hypothetical protein
MQAPTAFMACDYKSIMISENLSSDKYLKYRWAVTYLFFGVLSIILDFTCLGSDNVWLHVRLQPKFD